LGADAPTDEVCFDDTCAPMRRELKVTTASHHNTGPAGPGDHRVTDDNSLDDGLALMQKKMKLMISDRRTAVPAGAGNETATDELNDNVGTNHKGIPAGPTSRENTSPKDASFNRSLALLELQDRTDIRSRLGGKALSDHLSAVAKAHPAGSPTAELFQSFRICGRCAEFKRFGETHDGGYLTCMDRLGASGIREAYSLGVEHHDKWSDDASQELGIPVNQFDCTVSQGTGCKTCEFFPRCIVGEGLEATASIPGMNSEPWTLHRALVETGQGRAPDRSLLMKVDIEASEWPLFATASPSVLKKFQQIIVEFHWLSNSAKHDEYLEALQRIHAAGFMVVHLHGNNNGGMYEDGGLSVPDVLEVTFVSGAEQLGECKQDQEFIPGLDHRNNIDAKELPPAHLAE